MNGYKLIAEREACEDRVMGEIAFAPSPEAAQDWAADLVDEMEEDGDSWPEGHDAVLVEVETGRRWAYTDEWEERP